MISLRLLIEYGAYPLWIYDEDGDVIDTDLPNDWKSDIELKALLDDIQNQYESLFINNSHEFSFVGFKGLKEKNDFVSRVKGAVEYIEKKNNNKYVLLNSIDDDFYDGLYTGLEGD